MESLVEMTGMHDRNYVALTLPGRFYDPRGSGPPVRPHIEIPSRILYSQDPAFPDRLAEIGNGLRFPWWVFPEVTATRRALFNTPKGPLDELLVLLRRHRQALIGALDQLMLKAMPNWDAIERVLIADPLALAGPATGDVDEEELSDYFPEASQLNLEVRFDSKLRESHDGRASRRVGVWQLVGTTSANQQFALGVISPRLTANSLFKDRLFSPATESAASLLVRGVIMRRIIRDYLSVDNAVQVGPGEPDPDTAPAPRLRAVPARVGAKLPEASVDAAIRFLQTYQDPDQAWALLETWSTQGYMLTVTKEGFVASHRNALRYLRRAEDPERDDINVVLPLAWSEGKVVRATFARPPSDGSPAVS